MRRIGRTRGHSRLRPQAAQAVRGPLRVLHRVLDVLVPEVVHRASPLGIHSAEGLTLR